MSRYFLAIELPENIKDLISELSAKRIPGLRFVKRSNLHLTLNFLGELSEVKLETLGKSLQRIHFPCFNLSISQLGTFPNSGRPKVIWAGIEDSHELIHFQSQLTETLVEAIGYKPEERPYSPHITIARVNHSAREDDVDRFLSINSQIESTSFEISGYSLFSSNFGESDQTIIYQQERLFLLT